MDPSICATVSIMSMCNEEYGPRRSVRGYGDEVQGLWEDWWVIIGVGDGYVNLCTTVDGYGACVGLQGQQGEGQGLVVQTVAGGDDA